MSDECVSVVVGTFVADGVTPDADGIVWTVERIEGWFDSASVRVSTQETQPIGEVITAVRENGRPIVITITAARAGGLRLGGALCFQAIDSIEIPFACVYASKRLDVIDPVLALHASVRRVGPIKNTVLGTASAVRFQVQLLAEDPLRYDASDNPCD